MKSTISHQIKMSSESFFGHAKRTFDKPVGIFLTDVRNISAQKLKKKRNKKFGKISSSNRSPGHEKCSFVNPTDMFPSKIRKSFTPFQNPKWILKLYIPQKELFASNCSGHVKWSVDHPVSNFWTKLQKLFAKGLKINVQLWISSKQSSSTWTSRQVYWSSDHHAGEVWTAVWKT